VGDQAAAADLLGDQAEGDVGVARHRREQQVVAQVHVTDGDGVDVLFRPVVRSSGRPVVGKRIPLRAGDGRGVVGVVAHVRDDRTTGRPDEATTVAA